jgi:hypothetical protein
MRRVLQKVRCPRQENLVIDARFLGQHAPQLREPSRISCRNLRQYQAALLLQPGPPQQLNLTPDYTDPDIYLKSRKLSAQFHAPDETTSPIDTEALVTYANSDDFAHSVALLTRISTLKCH